MIAVVELKEGKPPCIVKWVGRKGLKVKILTYCGGAADAGQGVTQVVDGTSVCEKCKIALKPKG
jgi:hypothetical protein